MKKGTVAGVVGFVILGALAAYVASSTQQKQLVDSKAEVKRFIEVLHERHIDAPTSEQLADLCKEGFLNACADAAQHDLRQCQEHAAGAEAVCERAKSSLLASCSQGFIMSCDTIFQSAELIGARAETRALLEKFCSSNIFEACLTYETALRDQLDLDRTAQPATPLAANPIRQRYISMSDENCGRGHLFSCLSVLDEDASTADHARLARAEERLHGLCGQAKEQFEVENCRWFAEYLAQTKRADEAQKYEDLACEKGWETGCFEAAKISFSANNEAHGFEQLQRSCGAAANAAPTIAVEKPEYCDSFEAAMKAGVKSWEALKTRETPVEGQASTFAVLMHIEPRQPY